MKDNRLLLGLCNKLDKLLDEHTEIFFEERPFLEEFTLEPEVIQFDDFDERRTENEIAIKKTKDAIAQELSGELPKETQKPIQKGIFSMAD